MKKNNIALISLYESDTFPGYTLSAILKREGFNVKSIIFKHMNKNYTLDYPTKAEIDTLVKLVKKFEPLFVGITVRSTVFKLACEITKDVKKKVDTLVVWGGIHPTAKPVQSLEFADVICIGEGDKAIVELATKLLNGEEIDRIQNLWIKKDNKIVRNDLRPLVQDLNSIPFPDFSDENIYFVEGGKVLSLPSPEYKKSYRILTSRGCFFNCTYCYNNILRRIYKDKGNYVRRRSVKNVIKELIYAKKRFKNLKFIEFWDDVFTYDIDWMRKFSIMYKRYINLPFWCYWHSSLINEEIIQLLKSAGIKFMTIGLQSGSERIRRDYFKRYETNEEIIKFVRILHKHKIEHSYDIIFSNPLETEKDMEATFNFLMKVPRSFYPWPFLLTHFPGTELTELLLGKGIISNNDIEDQKQQGYARWNPALDLLKDKKNLFWDNLFYLIRRRYIPKWFLSWLSTLNFLKRNPKLLTQLLRLTSDDILTVRNNSKIDIIRLHFVYFCRLPFQFLLIIRNKLCKY